MLNSLPQPSPSILDIYRNEWKEANMLVLPSSNLVYNGMCHYSPAHPFLPSGFLALGFFHGQGGEMHHISESPRSTSSFSGFSGSPPKLASDTLALLESFLSAKADEDKRFNDLAEQAAARVASLALNVRIEETDPPMMSVDEYRLAFGEDWQLSQFW
ncbi:hypothetical protein D9615_007220 [Tricholomella constricta]|uniref:Uncharacterized protein n=1 Tax=Tricholomella constricta TaxID=117010 RepID=A0A8H5H565_9AGAR|nr:hypothetical protein D9615_007220 [Tricholomella constricta]